MKKPLHHLATRHLHGRILWQLVIFVLASVILIVISLNDVLKGNISFVWFVGSVIVGLIVGLFIGRMFLLSWHEDTQKVIMRMDKLSILLLAAYIIFRVFSKQIFGEFLSGEALTDVTFCSLAGIMIGRLISMTRTIKKILYEQKIID